MRNFFFLDYVYFDLSVENRIFITFSPNQGKVVEMELWNLEVDEWEIEVNRVLLQDVIGRGAFGAVWRALLSSPNGRPGNRTVAAKCFTRKIQSSIFSSKHVDGYLAFLSKSDLLCTLQ